MSKELVDGLSKFKYDKDHLCLAREQGKSKKASFPSQLVPRIESKLELIHMDLCGPMRVESINGKKYIFVIFDDYSLYTLVYFLHTKYEAPNTIINFINQVQRNFKAKILKIRTDNGTKFKNEKLQLFYEKLGIIHHKSSARTPQQNGVVERRNCTLVEDARTMLIFSKTPKFLWPEAITTACFTQNRSIVPTRYNKTPYELIHGRKPNSSRGFHSSEDSQSVPSKTDLDNLFGPLYEEYYATSPPEVSDNSAANTFDNNDTSSSSIVVEEDESPQIVSSSTEQVEPNTPVLNENANEIVQEDVTEFDGNVFYYPPQTPAFKEAESSLTYQDLSNMNEFHQTHRSIDKWTKNHPINNDFARFNTIITSLKAPDEAFSRKNYVRKFLRALHPKWRAKVMTIEELKDLSSLALDELIDNLKLHEVVMKKDFENYRGKKERVKSIALKAQKESSDDKTSTSRSDDE
ncbi:retrovirus-related pol polyprotein from transposon TNT 1-94 [Tanacetum coccineum]|uniref:Retrovirus-related pol polyprotein from transposon TNT 1-94 n=1 Tax=Tanacetum coccineum TaxID=301880 RepID=A0ABQ5GJN4_9ASTR